MAKSIMIADDPASTRTVFGIALGGKGYTVIEGIYPDEQAAAIDECALDTRSTSLNIKNICLKRGQKGGLRPKWRFGVEM